MACDLVVAAEGTKLGEPEIRYGSAPVTLLMPYLIGQKKTRELLLTGDLIDAVEAERIGLINRVVPADRLAAEVDALADRLARTPPEVMAPDEADAQPGDGRRRVPAGGRGGPRPRRDHQRRATRPSSASGTRSSVATGSRPPSPGATGATTNAWPRVAATHRPSTAAIPPPDTGPDRTAPPKVRAGVVRRSRGRIRHWLLGWRGRTRPERESHAVPRRLRGRMAPGGTHLGTAVTHHEGFASMYQAPTTVTPVASEAPPRRRRRGILALLLGLTVVSLGAGMFSLALFTDQPRSRAASPRARSI